ncbi:hypothetical protein GTY73_09915 [Streptomyces sp. SID8354]|nr:hypothetical protein [Streptomyces sp. SID8354]
MRAALRAASGVLGAVVAEPVVVGSSSRSVVLRCSAGAGAGSAIVKAFRDDPEGRRSFTSEAAGLSLGLAGPELLGVDAAASVVVMEDVGTGLSLADALVGGDCRLAGHGLRAWARELGRLAALSLPRRAEFDRRCAEYDKGVAWWGSEPWIERNGEEFLAVLDAVHVAAPAGLAAELGHLTAAEHRFPALTPGDSCPYNALLAPNGVRLIDFEGAGFQSVFLTAAYCRSPFPSCWCVCRIPDAVAAAAERTYRAEVAAVYPELGEEAVWEAGMRWATAVWTVDATAYWLPRVVAGDGPLHPRQPTGPTRRQVLRYRWERAEAALAGGDFRAVGETAGVLLRRIGEGWAVPPLPLYPAFAGAPRRAAIVASAAHSQR